MKRSLAFPVLAAVALVAAPSAVAHARVSPTVTLAKSGEVFTLAVPTEKENATTTKIELTPPQGFNIDSFVPSQGWKRNTQETGSGENAVITKVTWDGGRVPTGEDAAFSFIATTDAAKTYTFAVRQTYSDGSVVDWSGPESSDTSAPTIEAKSSFGGGNSTLAVIALIVGGIALVAAAAALMAASGSRSLT
jgi:uncharacterized protein YcnI